MLQLIEGHCFRNRTEENPKVEASDSELSFQPVAFETFRRTGSLTVKFLLTLVARSTEVSGDGA